MDGNRESWLHCVAGFFLGGGFFENRLEKKRLACMKKRGLDMYSYNGREGGRKGW